MSKTFEELKSLNEGHYVKSVNDAMIEKVMRTFLLPLWKDNLKDYKKDRESDLPSDEKVREYLERFVDAYQKFGAFSHEPKKIKVDKPMGENTAYWAVKIISELDILKIKNSSSLLKKFEEDLVDALVKAGMKK
jgi:hypothetical protein